MRMAWPGWPGRFWLVGRGPISLLRCGTCAMWYRRDAGVSRHEVLEVLESLRADSLDDQTEDTILDLMDTAAGFCPIEKSLWRRPFSR